MTAVFAELDPGGWLQLVIYGHPPPLLLAADGGLRPLSPPAYATPLGLHPDMQPSTFTVHVGDRLLFYTDGLLEARDKAGRYFRPEDCQDTLRDQDLQAAADGLLDRLAAHAGRRLDDDVALLLVEIAVPPAGNQQGPASALALGSPAVAGHRTPALTGASAITAGREPDALARALLAGPAARNTGDRDDCTIRPAVQQGHERENVV